MVKKKKKVMNKFLSLKRRISNDQAPIIVKEISTIKVKPRICIGRIHYVLVTRLPVLGKYKINLRRKAKLKMYRRDICMKVWGYLSLWGQIFHQKPKLQDIKAAGFGAYSTGFLPYFVLILTCYICPVSPFVIRMFVYYILYWNYSSWILYCWNKI